MRKLDKAMDPISCKTHFIGALLSALMLVLMMVIAIIERSDKLTIIGITVFSLSSIALYSASSIYHYYNAAINNKVKLFL